MGFEAVVLTRPSAPQTVSGHLSSTCSPRLPTRCRSSVSCLGHQSIAQAFGGQITRAKALMHGKTSPIHHNGEGLFAGLPRPVHRHALPLARQAPPRKPALDVLGVTAWTDDGEVMGLRHVSRPIFGEQFHPESIRHFEGGHQMLANFPRPRPA